MNKTEPRIHYYTGNTPCTWWCRIFCLLGLHRWDSPGGQCECCGKHDDFFDEG